MMTKDEWQAALFWDGLRNHLGYYPRNPNHPARSETVHGYTPAMNEQGFVTEPNWYMKMLLLGGMKQAGMPTPDKAALEADLLRVNYAQLLAQFEVTE